MRIIEHKIEIQGEPILDYCRIMPISSDRIVFLEIEMKSKYCSVGKCYTKNGVPHIEIQKTDTSLYLNDATEEEKDKNTIISIDELTNWNIYLTGCDKYVLKFCLFKT